VRLAIREILADKQPVAAGDVISTEASRSEAERRNLAV
jgi:hypothetical protein